MNILLFSPFGEALTLVQKLREEGHDVLLHVEDEAYKRIGDGLCWKTEDPDKAAEQADIIVFTENGCGKIADRYREKGYTVWCGGTWVERLEYDRLYGMEIFREAGINIPPTFEVSSIADVKSLVESEFRKEKKAVIKVSGEGGAGSSFSYVADDMDLLCEQVEHWEEDGLLGSTWNGILQKFIPGLEVSCEGWWNGEEWSNINITLEEKKLLSGGLGPSVGCASNIISMISPKSKLFRLMVEPMGEILKQHGYVGQMDTNSIIGEDGVPYALEFTPRLGYNSTPTMAYGWGFGALLERTFHLGDPEIPSTLAAAGLTVSVPPYPVEHKDEKMSHDMYDTCCGTPIDGFEAVEDRFYLFDAMKGERGLCVAGCNGIVGIAMGSGDDPVLAGKEAYRVAERLRIPNKSYRYPDAFKRGASDLMELLSSKMIQR